MARATRNAHRQAARLGLLVALGGGCATIQVPPGGPPDFTAPIILSFSPDSGAVVDGFRDDAVIQFDEVINERSGGGLENLVLKISAVQAATANWEKQTLLVTVKSGMQLDDELVYGAIRRANFTPGRRIR